MALFMDPARAHQLTWLPSPAMPLRYFDEAQRLCVTVRGGQLVKATCADDSAGLAYANPKGRRVAAWDRMATIVEGRLRLKDRERTMELSLPQGADRSMATEGGVTLSPVGWRSVFAQGVPAVQPGEVFGAVLLYPQDETPISELAAQPFVADYLQDLAEQDREIGQILLRAERILIENGDAVISTCIPFDRPRDVSVTVWHPAFACKQAQQLWTQCHEIQRWEWLQRTQFRLATAQPSGAPAGASHDLAYVWVPYAEFDQASLLLARLRSLAQRMKAGGNAFVVGPARLGDEWPKAGFQLCWQEAVERLPTFAMHKTILPKAKMRSGLTMFHVRRM